jgi:aminoglycoside phosphotransferase (APT) family kinase protein
MNGEPLPPQDGWIPWGGEAVWAVGETPGGAPYGLTPEDFRAAAERDSPGAGWVRAKSILRRAVQGWVDGRTMVEVGWVKKVGAGLSRDLFAAEVNVSPDLEKLSGVYVVLLPRRDAPSGLDARTSREAAVLRRLAQLDLPFSVPRVIGVIRDADRLVLVREFLEGIDMDPRAGQQPGVRPWELVGQLAAAIHKIDLTGFLDLLPGYATRRNHAEALLRVFMELEGAEAEDAHAWAREHLPPAVPAVFVHGDLLGQNILLHPGKSPAVIDWEYAIRRDPAYDLGIVTRGVRRPFQIDQGLERLLNAYATAGGSPLALADVRFHELCLAAGWYREALAGKGAEPPDQARQRLRGILARSQKARQ